MSYFNSLTLTTKGQEMLLSSNTNIDKKITFTNASLGSEKLLPEEIKESIEIKNFWLKFPLNTVRIINDESNYFLRTEIAFTNTGITESKIMRELGIYAKFENEEEVLFAYSTTDDDGETIPKEEIVPATYKFTIDTTISTETKINQTLSPEGFLTKEVIELLKYYIANIAVQRFKGTLTAGQTIININSEGSLLSILSKRLQLFIGGELYSEGTDYIVNVENNTIHLNDEFRFEEGTIFEIIDNLPPGYVKELLDEFFKKANEKELEVLKNLETVQIENIEAIKTLSKQVSDFLDNKNVTIIGSLDKKIEEFYLELDTYIEKNKEKLKGKSLYQSWLDIGNIGSESDFVVAMKIKGDDGNPGRGIVSTTIRKGEDRQRIITIIYTDDTTNELIVEDGQSAYEVWKNIGNDGTEIDFFKSLQGAGLEYLWRGTELGVRVAGEAEYTFVDLIGVVELAHEDVAGIVKGGRESFVSIKNGIIRPYKFHEPEPQKPEKSSLRIGDNTDIGGVTNIAIGIYALGNTEQSNRNIAIGNEVYRYGQAFNSITIGHSAAKRANDLQNSTIIGHGAMEQENGRNNVVIGNEVRFEGRANVVIGVGAMPKTRPNDTFPYANNMNENTAVGYNSFSSGLDKIYNSACIGANSRITGSNQVQLGDNRTTVFAYGSVQNRSDERDKTDIKDTSLGLEFLMKLKPKEYRWDYRESYVDSEKLYNEIEVIEKSDLTEVEKKEAIEKLYSDNLIKNIEKDGSKKGWRYHQGFIAQEVFQVMRTLGVDFGGYQDHSINGGEDILSLGYQEFIPILVKGIQEQQKTIENLIKRIENLELKGD